MSALTTVGVSHFVVVSAILFVCGLLTVSTRRNAVAVLMGIELMLNAAALNFVAFGHFGSGGIDGAAFTVFIIVLAAAGAAVALAIVLALFRQFRSIDTERISTLRD